jgi:hypothetical protein
MRLPDPIAPYASLLKVLVIAIMGAALFIGGCSHGKRVQLDIDQAKLGKASAALHVASNKLTAAANALWDIDARTKANKAAAEAQLAHAEVLAKQARTDHAQAEKDVARLEQQLREERDGCADARRPVCGIPLR